MAWDIEAHTAGDYMYYMRQVTTMDGMDANSLLRHVAHGLEGWDERLNLRHGRGDPDRPVRPTDHYAWVVAGYSATAHDILAEAVASVDLNHYSAESRQLIECWAQVVERVVTAWHVLLEDIIDLRDQGLLRDPEACLSVTEQASGAIEMARNTVLAAHR